MITVKQDRRQSKRLTERRILANSYATGLMAGFAFLVRGSSRRITTMTAGRKARSANIRVINRRKSSLDCRLLCFTGKAKAL